MIGVLTLLLGFYTSYHVGREATKTEMEYRCFSQGKVELAYSEYECKKKLRTLDWVKKVERQ